MKITKNHPDYKTIASVHSLLEELAISLEMFQEDNEDWSPEAVEAIEKGAVWLRDRHLEVPEPARWILFRAGSAESDGCPVGPDWANRAMGVA